VRTGWMVAVLVVSGLPAATAWSQSPGGASGRPGAGVVSRKPEYWKDARFTGNPVPVSARPLRLRSLVRLLVQRTGKRIEAQADWGRETVALDAPRLSPAELMDLLAKAFPGTWFRQGETWVLAADPQRAEVTLLDAGQRAQRSNEFFSALIDSLNEQQQRQLSASGKLDLGALSSAQRDLMAGMVYLDYYDPQRPPELAPSPASLTGQSVSLRVQGKGQQAVLWVFAGRAGKNPGVGIKGRSFFGRQGGKRLLPFAPPH
jgi:hypothetical protein